MGAFKNRPWPIHFCRNKDVKDPLYQGEPLFGISMEKAVIHLIPQLGVYTTLGVAPRERLRSITR